jgi:group I intron endonuclease
MKNVSGVYEIEIAGYKYYGSSINIYARKQNHITKLRSGMHRNLRLQRCFNKYGKDAMEFKILVLCDEESVLDEEQKYLDKNIGNDNCLNFCKSASAPMAGIKFSDNHKKKMSESQIRNKYIFYYDCGKTESFDSLKLAGDRFGVKRAIVSRWFKRKNLGRNHGILQSNNIIKVEKIGDEHIILLPWQYKQEPWQIAGATSKTQYYKEKRNEIKTRDWQSVS